MDPCVVASAVRAVLAGLDVWEHPTGPDGRPAPQPAPVGRGALLAWARQRPAGPWSAWALVHGDENVVQTVERAVQAALWGSP